MNWQRFQILQLTIDIKEKESGLLFKSNLDTEIDLMPTAVVSVIYHFLGEPYHDKNIVVNNSDIERLNVTQEIRDYSLSTNLIDFLIKNGLPFFKSDLLLVPTSNVESMLDL